MRFVPYRILLGLVEAMGAGSAVLAHGKHFNRWVAGPGARYFEGKQLILKVHCKGGCDMTTATMVFFDGRITIDPAVCNGKPTIRGKRITVQTILEFLGAGESEEEILNQYPSLEAEDIKTCLRFAASLMDKRYELAQVA